jgi:serine/threonine protein kinase
MAEIIGGGEPVNDSERAVIRHLRDHGLDDWFFWHNIDVPLQNGRKGDIDILLVTGHAIYLIDVKGTRGRIDVARRRWYPSNRQAFYSPVDKLRNHVRAFKGHLTSRGLDGRIFVNQLVVLTAPDARLIDSGTGSDTDAMHVVIGLDDLVSELDQPERVQPRFLRDIHQYRQQIIRAVDGAVQPRTGPLRFGHWEVTESLGESGESGEVAEYRARNVNSNDPAAPPVMLRIYHSDPFQDESVRAAKRVAISNAYHMLERVRFHECVVPCRDFFPNDDESQFVLVLEDVTAGALFLRLTDPQRALTADERVRIIRDMLRGLAYVHANGVLHRALSPATVLVTSTGGAMLTGFDYARPETPRSSSQSVANRLPEVLDEMYVAPECQSHPLAMSTASDVYAAGVIAFHVLTGEPPFATSVDQHLRESILPDAPMAATGLQPPVIDLLRRMCARNPAHRPSAAAALKSLTAAPEPSPDQQRNDYRNLPEGHQLTRKYTVRRAIGRGSFGTVYQVYDNLAGADRAVKIVDRDHISLVSRTQQEYQTLLRLPLHENVVKVENADYLDGEGVPYLVFEYLDGKDVGKLLKMRALGPADTIRLGIHVATGLKFLHERGVIHCDIKPGNLLWTDRGCKIIDFNVAVTEESSLSRIGGTAKYGPPDTNRSAPPTVIDLKDRDVYGLGVTLYQVLTGRFPFSSGTPSLGEIAADPRSDSQLKDLSDEVVTTLLKAIAPLRGDRYGSAADFLAALQAITAVHRKPTPKPAPIPLPSPGEPNVNPFVAHLQSLYSQSQASNAGTRGSDTYGTYVATALDENLIPDVLDGAYRLVIITGNAGDGKTAFLEHLIEQATERGGERGAPRANGVNIALSGGHLLRTNNDGSQDEGDRANDEVLQEFFAPFANGTTANHNETRLIAINEGRLVDFLTEHEDQFTTLTETVRDGLMGKAPGGDIAVINLNQRSLVAATGDAGEPGPPVFDRVLAELTSERRWAECATCDLVQTCYAPHNAQTFAHPSAGPKITARLRELYRIVHLRGQLHVTLRDLRSALAYMLTSGRDCTQIHELYRTGEAKEILTSFYFNSWLGMPDSADRLLRLLRELDVAAVPEPSLDGKLAAIGPTADQVMMTIDQRSTYDLDLLKVVFNRLRQAEPTQPAAQSPASIYLASARRRFYFECIDDDRARTALPFKSAQRFLYWISRRGELKEKLPELVAAINRGERLPDVALADGGLAVATRDVPGGTIRSYRIFPQESLSLSVSDSPGNRYVEGEPDSLELTANGTGGHVTTLRIRLDLFELLEHQRQGYMPSVAELQGRYLDLLIFKNELLATPYQEVVLTTGGTDAHRIRRELDGRLVMASLIEGDNDDDA